MLGVSCVTLFFGLLAGVLADVHLYVSPHGDDANNGLTTSAPILTIQHALSLARSHANQNIVIELMAGYHDLHKSIVLQQNKITIRAYNNQEVHVTGGKRIDSTHFKHVTNHTILNHLSAVARDHVRIVHLPDVGITDYGTFSSYGFAMHRTAPLEVFYNHQPLRFSQWPDTGFINIVGVPDGENGTRFRYNSDVPKTWLPESNPWVYGYWYWSWADKAMQVASLDTSSMTVTLTKPTQFGLRTGHWDEHQNNAGHAQQGGYFRFVNILSALDKPGEYYMDTDTGNLYVWIPNNDGNVKPSDAVYVSLLENCIQINQHVHDIVIEGFTLEVCRGYGIRGWQVADVQIKQMEIRNIGSRAISLGGDSRGCAVSQCLIYNTDGGISMGGGNRKTLESSLNTIENCEIFNFSRVASTSADAIAANGVGHLIRNNHVYDGQYTAIHYYGNDITMEYNLVHHACMNASDCGAFQTGRDWTTRGNVIRYNIIHDVLRRVPGADCRGIMLDDQSSSTSITHNVFYDNHVHTNIGGGRDNIISYNVMYNATKASIQVDHRGTGVLWYDEMQPRLHNMPYKSSVWTLRYPVMATLDSHNLNQPEGNQIVSNIVFNGPNIPYVYSYDQQFRTPAYFNVTLTGTSVGKPNHYNVDVGDLRIKCLAATWANQHNFPQVVSPNDVGPKVQPGPVYVHRGRTQLVTLPSHNTACTTAAPSSNSPMPAYLPDGSRHNDLYNVSSVGCWLIFPKCTDHPNAAGTYRDTWGEAHEHAGTNETLCLHRAVEQWRYCGSHVDEQVVAVYGPTGATILAGDGCFMAIYGCPRHGGPADGHVIHGQIYRDTYAENALNAKHNETACLSRAHTQWTWCGSNRNHPVTSIYRPTGAVLTIGAGCWIHVQKCPSHPQTKSMFYDAWGDTNYHTDDSQYACLHQAEYYWTYCGSDSTYPVTATYRPTGQSKTGIVQQDYTMLLWTFVMFLPFHTSMEINMTTIIDDMFRHYDKRIPPRHDQVNKQVDVQINIHVTSMYSISETNMDYSMAMLIGQKWLDERLQFNDTLNFTRLELDSSLFDHVWIPDLYILNEHTSDFHEVMVPNKFIHVYPNGTVHHLARVTGTYSCHMLLHKYPFDTQYCHIEVGSFGHRLENIRFIWHEESLTMDEAVDFPQFCLTNVREYNCERKFLGSVYPCIGLEFKLKRNYAYFIIEIYIPSILIVVLSWLSFWIDCTAVPARVSLGLLTVLTMTTQSSGSKSEFARVSYVKALDVYLTTCLACVFLGLLEFAYVNVLTQKDNNNITNKIAGNNMTGSCCALGKITLNFKNKPGIDRARFVDNVSKIVFPGAFIVFNIVYWVYYLLF